MDQGTNSPAWQYRDNNLFEAVTHDIHVAVRAGYLDDQSNPKESFYMWGYHITITNKRDQPVQLLSRHWVITDGAGQVRDIRGKGVVGQQPRILPGTSFRYSSGTPLATPTGFMQGHYEMITKGGETLSIEIPAFSLDSPVGTYQVN